MIHGRSNAGPIALSGYLFYLFWILLVFEGAVRTWIFPGGSLAIQVTRDLLPAAALVLLILRPKYLASSVPRVALQLTAMYVLAGFMSVFLSGFNTSPIIVFLGLRTHFAYIPLMILIPFHMRNVGNFRNASLIIAGMAILVSSLAFYQTTQSPASWINAYASGEDVAALFGKSGIVRATGTFSYITGMAMFSIFGFAISALGALLARSRMAALVCVIGVWASVMAGVSTGSRGALFWMLAISLMTAVFSWGHLSVALRSFRRVKLPLLLGGCVVVMKGSMQILAMRERIESAGGDEGVRSFNVLFGWLGVIFDKPGGFGIGAGHQQAGALLGGQAGFMLGAEEEWTRIALELGLLGFIVFLFVRIVLFIQGLRFSLRTRSAYPRFIAATGLAIYVSQFTSGVYTPMSNAMLWAGMGMVFAAWRIDRLERDSAR